MPVFTRAPPSKSQRQRAAKAKAKAVAPEDAHAFEGFRNHGDPHVSHPRLTRTNHVRIELRRVPVLQLGWSDCGMSQARLCL